LILKQQQPMIAKQITYSHQPGSEFPLGTTEVTVTATDPSGNYTRCSFTVTVVDEEAPVITCPEDVFTAADAGKCGAAVQFEATAN
jgi:hypothetical protein